LSNIIIGHRAELKGEVIPPPDKSISHRAIMISSIAKGGSIIRNFLDADDPMRTLQAFRSMGINIEIIKRDQVKVYGKGLKGLISPKDIIDCGNSGTTMRLLSGILAAQEFISILTGDESLKRRPMERIITPLSLMGAEIESHEGGYPPLKIKGGRLRPITYKTPVASAQVKSCILLAGLYCNGVTTVIEPSRSRDHTERILSYVGADIKSEGLAVSIRGGKELSPLDLTIPGDFSSAAFFIVAGLITPRSEIIIKNTGLNPTRTGLLDILKEMGADIRIENKRDVSGEPVGDIIVKSSRLHGIDIDPEIVPRAIDEFPVICVAASLAQGRTIIKGASELRVKESDRISTMATELRKMGVDIEELEDGLIINGREDLLPARLYSHGDHRVAMALMIAAMRARGECTIEDIECVNISFPQFPSILKRLK